jgi:hypothetical protein
MGPCGADRRLPPLATVAGPGYAVDKTAALPFCAFIGNGQGKRTMTDSISKQAILTYSSSSPQNCNTPTPKPQSALLRAFGVVGASSIGVERGADGT